LQQHLDRYRALANSLDARFRIPGTPIRFGWDAILGLIPGAGDAIGGLVGGYGLWVGTRLGAPWVVLARMLFNLAVDVIGGAFPLVGDLFDIGWRGNLRNLALLESWLEKPHQTRSRSIGLFVGLFGVLVGVSLVALGISVWLLQAMIGVLSH
jgi:hypothetical protein